MAKSQVEQNKIYRAKNIVKVRFWARRWKQKKRRLCGEEVRANQREYQRKRRLAVIFHYGGRCACCGELEPKFLAIDHINNDGAVHRKILTNDNIVDFLF